MFDKLKRLLSQRNPAVPLGSAPIDYRRGKRSGTDYKSPCLGYGFRIPEGCKLHDELQLGNSSTLENIADLWGQLPSGVNCGVNFLPMDGSVKPEEIDIEMFGRAMVEQTNTTRPDRHATYLGIEEISGYPCAHTMIELEQRGIRFYSELYTYFAPYAMLQFGFTYTMERMGDMKILKQSFFAL